MRNYSVIDKFILKTNSALQTIHGQNAEVIRKNPATDIPESNLTIAEKSHITGLMRVNHVGEVCAQALYEGQALTARSTENREKLQTAALEEVDHLVWCEERIKELGGRVSYLNPLWYTASLMLGILAGLAGDAVNMGFLAETERQVEKHLTEHLKKLPPQDKKTQHILEQMRADEINHAVFAEENGAADLPLAIRKLMQIFSKFMTTTAYWI